LEKRHSTLFRVLPASESMDGENEVCLRFRLKPCGNLSGHARA